MLGRVTAWLIALSVLGQVPRLGDGHWGAKVISARTTVNAASALSAPAAAGQRVVAVANGTIFHTGDLVLLHQTQVAAVPPENDAGTLDLTAAAAGRFDWVRVQTQTGTTLTMEAPLEHDYESPGAQAVVVPEYTDLTITATGAVIASPWNGAAGGLIVFLATGTVKNDGLVDASGSGFRAGLAADSTGTNCSSVALDEPFPRGAQPGEGILTARGTGRRNAANGGGGGNCTDGGGGGGGHRGRGGSGGHEAVLNFGYPGARLDYVADSRLFLGGGGGAGWANWPFFSSSNGSNGGGAILARGLRAEGAGRYRVNGVDSAVGPGLDFGMGGGGAGGAVFLDFQQSIACGSSEATGGAGGTNVNRTPGPGGGGAGGLVLLRAPEVNCPSSVNHGLGGRAGLAGPFNGATPTMLGDPSALGTVLVVNAIQGAPALPIITSPRDGERVFSLQPRVLGTGDPGATVRLLLAGAERAMAVVDAAGGFVLQPDAPIRPGEYELRVVATRDGLSSPRTAPIYVRFVDPEAGPPFFVSQGATTAFCGTPYRYSGSHRPEVVGSKPMAFSLVGDGPFTVDAQTGELSWSPTRKDVGEVTVDLRASNAEGDTDQIFTVIVECPEPLAANLGCSTTGETTWPWALFALAWLARRSHAGAK